MTLLALFILPAALLVMGVPIFIVLMTATLGGILLSITGGSDMGLFEVNEAAEVIHGVAHPDANIIFGTVIDDEMGDEVRVTVIAAGVDRWDDPKADRPGAPAASGRARRADLEPVTDVFGTDDDDDLDLDGGGDDFDVPSFLK